MSLPPCPLEISLLIVAEALNTVPATAPATTVSTPFPVPSGVVATYWLMKSASPCNASLTSFAVVAPFSIWISRTSLPTSDETIGMDGSPNTVCVNVTTSPFPAIPELNAVIKRSLSLPLKVIAALAEAPTTAARLVTTASLISPVPFASPAAAVQPNVIAFTASTIS